LHSLKEEITKAESKFSNSTSKEQLREHAVYCCQLVDQIEQLKKEKRATKDKLDAETGRVAHLQSVVSDLHEKFRQRDELETIKRLESEISELETQIKQQEEELAQSRSETNALKAEEEEIHKGVDQSVQADIVVENNEKEEESDDETFVYHGVDTPAEKLDSTPPSVLAEKSPELPTTDEKDIDDKPSQQFDPVSA
jgi:chromosome segregation ATPase